MQTIITHPPDVDMTDLFGSFESVAVVGNSPRLTEKAFGEDIDKHDLVIRINDGRTAPYAQNTGSKTSVRFVGALLKERYRAFFSTLSEDARLLTHPDNLANLREIGWTKPIEIIDNFGWTIRSSFTRLASVIDIGELPTRNPRTGIVIISLLVDAMRAGKPVSIYGMEMEKREEGAEHYYADGREFRTVLASYSKYHCPMDYEFMMLRKLSQQSLVTVH